MLRHQRSNSSALRRKAIAAAARASPRWAFHSHAAAERPRGPLRPVAAPSLAAPRDRGDHRQPVDRRRRHSGRQSARRHRQDVRRHEHHRARRPAQRDPGPARRRRARRPAHAGSLQGRRCASPTRARPTARPPSPSATSTEYFDTISKAAQSKTERLGSRQRPAQSAMPRASSVRNTQAARLRGCLSNSFTETAQLLTK